MSSKLTAIERQLDPFPLYESMRHSEPVYHDPERGNFSLFRYGDVQRALSDFESFSSQFRGDRAPNSGQPFAASLISTDPPRHRQLRSLVNLAFTPRAVEALAPRISEIVHEQIEGIASADTMDVVRDLANPLPVIVIAEMLGIPSQDREKFKRWSDFAVQTANFETDIDIKRFMGTEMMEMGMYFMGMIERRRQAPGDDLISGLLNASIDGEHLSQIELLGFCVLLLVAGNETTTNLLGNAMLTFSEHPELWARLREKPDLIPSAIEEVLRYRSPVQAMFRVTRKEVELEGQTLPAHARVVAWIGAANHDETFFENPEQVDIERSPNRHLAFGHGIHYCLGAPLARLEAKIALGALAEKVERFCLEPDITLQRQPSFIVYGLQNLPIQIDGGYS